MKKALKLALIYLVILIAGTVLGTLLYSLYLNLLSFVSGREITFFADSELFQSLFYVLPCVIILIMPLISYYRIRHPGGALQLIIFIILSLITWLVLMPCSLKLKNYCNKRFNIETIREPLSPNYFRQVDNNVYYFTREFQSEAPEQVPQAPAVVINTNEFGSIDYRSIGDYPGFALNRKAQPYREIQLKNIFGDGENPIPIDFRLLITKINSSYSGELRPLLLLLSFVVLICSVYGLTNIFEWRLLSTVMLFISTALILCLNSVYYSSYFDVIKSKIMDNSFFRFFNNIVSEPILFLINSFFALVFIISGIIRFAVRKHAKNAR